MSRMQEREKHQSGMLQGARYYNFTVEMNGKEDIPLAAIDRKFIQDYEFYLKMV